MGIYKHREKVKKKNKYNTKSVSKVVRNYREREVQFGGTRERERERETERERERERELGVRDFLPVQVFAHRTFIAKIKIMKTGTNKHSTVQIPCRKRYGPGNKDLLESSRQDRLRFRRTALL
jgi:hypothetical protein